MEGMEVIEDGMERGEGKEAEGNNTEVEGG